MWETLFQIQVIMQEKEWGKTPHEIFRKMSNESVLINKKKSVLNLSFKEINMHIIWGYVWICIYIYMSIHTQSINKLLMFKSIDRERCRTPVLCSELIYIHMCTSSVFWEGLNQWYLSNNSTTTTQILVSKLFTLKGTRALWRSDWFQD